MQAEQSKSKRLLAIVALLASTLLRFSSAKQSGLSPHHIGYQIVDLWPMILHLCSLINHSPMSLLSSKFIARLHATTYSWLCFSGEWKRLFARYTVYFD